MASPEVGLRESVTGRASLGFNRPEELRDDAAPVVIQQPDRASRFHKLFYDSGKKSVSAGRRLAVGDYFDVMRVREL